MGNIKSQIFDYFRRPLKLFPKYISGIEAQFQRVEAKEGDVILISVPKDTNEEWLRILVGIIHPRLPKDAKVICINNEHTLRTLDEETLEKMGLRKIPNG